MFNKSGITKTTGAAPKQILLFTQPYAAISVQVSDAIGVTVGGSKIVKAGTPLYGNLKDRTTAFVAPSTDNSAVGVLVHDVDVTNGSANGSLLLFGFVNTNRLDDDAKALITSKIETDLSAKVWFVPDETM